MKLSGKIQRDYPYVNARVSAKGAKLLQKSDYDKLLKMEPNEISRRLEEGEYKKEINELGSEMSGVPLVEAALKKNASRTLTELVEMSPGKLEEFLKIYIRRYDVENLKKILRVIDSDEEKNIEEEIIAPGLEYPVARLKEISEMEFSEAVSLIKFDGGIDYQEHLESADTLKEVEKALDQAYFHELEELMNRTGNRKMKNLLKSELEYENLRIILRLKKYGIEEKEIRERIFTEKPKGVLDEALKAEDLEEVYEVLSDSKWDVRNGSLEEVEHGLEVSRLRRARRDLRSSPLGPAPVIAYVIAKMVEVKNLRTMIQAKATGVMDSDEIRENLVIEDGR
jgi:V/A-type H+-transporting ATPase subunit C